MQPWKRTRWASLVVVIALALPFGVRAASPLDYTAIDAHVQAQMDASRVPGLALAIVQNDESIHVKGFGEAAAGRKVMSDTPFILGSSSKSFTALAIMQLVEAGKVALDAPVNRYLPSFRLADPQVSASITVRQLLNQTSGIPGNAGGESYRSTLFLSAAEALSALKGVTLVRQPGTGWEYANPNYVLLGLVIEAVSGQSYGAYLQQHVFAPLDMRHSYTSISEAQRAGLADGHRYWFGQPVAHEPIDVGALVPAGYIISTADDLSHYMIMFLNGGIYHGQTIVSKTGIDTLLNPVAKATLGPWADGATSSYAMGWFVGGPWGDQPVVFHPGEAPDFTSVFVIAPDRTWGMVTLMNADMQLPLPGGEGTLVQIPADVTSMMLGQDPTGGGSLTRFYILFDLFVAAIVAVQLWALVRLMRRRYTVQRSALNTGRMVVPLIWELGLGVLLLLAPSVVGMSWPAMRLWMPDLAITLLVVGTLWLISGVVRIARLVQAHGMSHGWLARARVSPRHALE